MDVSAHVCRWWLYAAIFGSEVSSADLTLPDSHPPGQSQSPPLWHWQIGGG